MYMQTPSKLVSPPINETDNIDNLNSAHIIRFHDGPEDDDILRDVRDYTSRINIDNNATYNRAFSNVLTITRATLQLRP